jgi:hypothetical protein
MFELELEGLSNEDKEFEMARAYVRFANNAVRRAASNPNFRNQPRRVARNATIGAARQFAPGLLKRSPGGRQTPGRPGAGRGGRPGAGGRPGFGRTAVAYGAGFNGNGFDPDQATATGTWYQQGNQIILNLE